MYQYIIYDVIPSRKKRENCIFNRSFVFSGIVIDHKSSPYGYFLKVEKKDPNLLSVEDEDVS